jgi:uncharacterized repeat protein (TIGR01451 family)
VVTVADSPDPVKVGKKLTYAITVANNGPGTAAGLQLTADLPTTVTFASVQKPAAWTCTTPTAGSVGDVSCTASSLASGASAQVKIVVTPTAVGPITTCASATTASTDPDSTNSTNIQQQTTVN